MCKQIVRSAGIGKGRMIAPIMVESAFERERMESGDGCISIFPDYSTAAASAIWVNMLCAVLSNGHRFC